MRLLHTTTYKLTTFFDDLIPPYVILSHTWGTDEVSFQDIASLESSSLLLGFRKIRLSCAQAAKDGFEWIWIDTCCIDKTSSTELSEAINSMFKWYQKSVICYAFLQDVNLQNDWKEEFKKSKWFRRGWTLQELVAPATVEFYDVSWNEIGTKRSLQEEVALISGVNRATLGGENLRERCVAERFSWASRRMTTREEDMAYCLIGLFDVNMPMLYGEGGIKAFTRLQEEILKTTNDYSLLAWRELLWDSENPFGILTILATSPSQFRVRDNQPNLYSNLRFHREFPSEKPNVLRMTSTPMFTNMGLDITLALRKSNSAIGESFVYLNCVRPTDGHILCIELRTYNLYDPDPYVFWRFRAGTIRFVAPETFEQFKPTRMYAITHMSKPISTPNFKEGARRGYLDYRIGAKPDSLSRLHIEGFYPPLLWDPEEQIFTGSMIWLSRVAATLSGVFECCRNYERLFVVAFGVYGPEQEPWCDISKPHETPPYGFSSLFEDYNRYSSLLKEKFDGTNFDGLADRCQIELRLGEQACVAIRKCPLTALPSDQLLMSEEGRKLFRIEVSLQLPPVGLSGR